MVTSRSRPQQMAQIFSAFAGQYRFGGRFSQIGQLILGNLFFGVEIQHAQTIR
jgi:hypothetical protein